MLRKKYEMRFEIREGEMKVLEVLTDQWVDLSARRPPAFLEYRRNFEC